MHRWDKVVTGGLCTGGIRWLRPVCALKGTLTTICLYNFTVICLFNCEGFNLILLNMNTLDIHKQLLVKQYF